MWLWLRHWEIKKLGLQLLNALFSSMPLFSYICCFVSHLFHFISVPWPLRRRPLPHCDSPPSLAFGWGTDAERSFDIVPVTQSFVCYLFCLCGTIHSYLLIGNLFSWCLQLEKPISMSIQKKKKKDFNASQLCFPMSCDIVYNILWLYSWEWLDRIGTSKEKTSGVMTMRVVSKGGWSPAGEIDSYLDENEAWCLWGERRAAFASKWKEVSQKWSLNESLTMKTGDV